MTRRPRFLVRLHRAYNNYWVQLTVKGLRILVSVIHSLFCRILGLFAPKQKYRTNWRKWVK